MANYKKLYINIGIITILLVASFFLFFSFSYGFDPTKMFVITASISIAFLIIIIASTILLKKKENNVLYQIADWLAFFAISLLIITTLINYFFMPARVVGKSMEDTLHDGDFVLTYHFNYTPKHNDVCAILVEQTLDGEDVNYVKRIIGIPGDALEIIEIGSTGDYKLYINGELYDDRKTIIMAYWINITGSSQLTFEIPENKYLAFGDNWDISTDSRFKGLFDISKIRGKVFFSFNGFKVIR